MQPHKKGCMGPALKIPQSCSHIEGEVNMRIKSCTGYVTLISSSHYIYAEMCQIVCRSVAAPQKAFNVNRQCPGRYRMRQLDNLLFVLYSVLYYLPQFFYAHMTPAKTNT